MSCLRWIAQLTANREQIIVNVLATIFGQHITKYVCSKLIKCMEFHVNLIQPVYNIAMQGTNAARKCQTSALHGSRRAYDTYIESTFRYPKVAFFNNLKWSVILVLFLAAPTFSGPCVGASPKIKTRLYRACLVVHTKLTAKMKTRMPSIVIGTLYSDGKNSHVT